MASKTLAHVIDGNEFAFQPRSRHGVESDWLLHCEFRVTSGRLWIGDPCGLHGDDGCVINVAPGTFRVEAKVMDFGGDLYVSRFRVFPSGVDVATGAEIGQTGTDSAAIGVADIESAEAGKAMEGDDVYERLDEEISDRCGVVELQNGAKVPWVNSGLGDGSAPVIALMSQGQVVGLEQEFMPPDYQFDAR